MAEESFTYYTDGNWHVTFMEGNIGPYQRIETAKKCIGFTYQGDSSDDWVEAHCNALLMAASPKLLDAVYAAYAVLDTSQRDVLKLLKDVLITVSPDKGVLDELRSRFEATRGDGIRAARSSVDEGRQRGEDPDAGLQL